MDFLLTEHRDKGAALRLLKKARRCNGLPETITIDGSGANAAAIKRYNEEHGTIMNLRQIPYFEFIPICGRNSRGSSTWRTRSSASVGCGATLSLAGASAIAASKTEAAYRRWASAIG
jgi:transposase-like protein